MRESSGPDRFQFYLAGLGSSAVAMGLQVVIFPWLVVGVLHESADRVGLAQMAVMLPNLLFILLGGALSDNRHLGSYLFRLYLLYLLPFGMMLMAINSGYLSYQLLIVFGASYGVITAFIQPARESLLSQVASEDLQRSVVRTTLVQFAAQSLGYLSAGLFDRIGLSILLVFQMLMFIAAGLFLRASQPAGVGLSRRPQRQSQTITAGLWAVWRHARLRPLMLLVGATGFLGFGGPECGFLCRFTAQLYSGCITCQRALSTPQWWFSPAGQSAGDQPVFSGFDYAADCHASTPWSVVPSRDGVGDVFRYID